MIVDVHCHYVSPRINAIVEREGERYGVRVQEKRGDSLLLPPRAAIARRLIEGWLGRD